MKLLVTKLSPVSCYFSHMSKYSHQLTPPPLGPPPSGVVLHNRCPSSHTHTRARTHTHTHTTANMSGNETWSRDHTVLWHVVTKPGCVCVSVCVLRGHNPDTPSRWRVILPDLEISSLSKFGRFTYRITLRTWTLWKLTNWITHTFQLCLPAFLASNAAR